MIVWINQHLHALQIALSKLLRNPFATLFSALVIALAAGLPAGAYVVLSNLAAVVGRADPDPQLTFFLALDAGANDRQAIEAKLKDLATIAEVRFISKEAALADLEASGIGEVVKSLERNPLPDAFIVRSRDPTPEVLSALKEEIANWPKVDHVQLDAEWAKKLHAIIAFAENMVLLVAIALGLALIAVVGNTIRLQILNQKDEIDVSRLIGATNGFIRRPFLYFGTLEALLGGLLTLGLILLGLHGLNTSLTELAQLYASDFRLRGPSRLQSLLLVLGVACLGWLGAVLSVNLYLRQLSKNHDGRSHSSSPY